jgi:protease YdgD
VTLRRSPRIAAALVLVLSAFAAGASDREDRLLDPEEARAYRAVGRLNVAGSRFCTAALIAPREIVTAAHCLFHPRTGQRVPVSEMRFVAGLYREAHASLRRVEAAAVPVDFELETEAPGDSIARDIALLRLAAPVGAGDATPLPVGVAGQPRDLSIVGYSRERAEAPSIVERCLPLGQRGGVLALSCRITFGASGAPVIDTRGDGNRIFAIASAIARNTPDRHSATFVVRVDPSDLVSLRRDLDRQAARKRE